MPTTCCALGDRGRLCKWGERCVGRHHLQRPVKDPATERRRPCLCRVGAASARAGRPLVMDRLCHGGRPLDRPNGALMERGNEVTGLFALVTTESGVLPWNFWRLVSLCGQSASGL